MNKLENTIQEIDAKIYEMVDGVIQNPYDSKKIVLSEAAIQQKIEQYKKYNKWVRYAYGSIMIISLMAIIFIGIFFKEIEYPGFFWSYGIALLVFPAEFAFKWKTDKLQTALFLKKINGKIEDSAKVEDVPVAS